MLKLLSYLIAEGPKHGSEKQLYPFQSSSLETENIRFNQNSVTAISDNKLQQTLQLNPESCLAMAPFMVNQAAHAKEVLHPWE